MNSISGIMANVFDSSAVYCGFEIWSGQTTEYKIGICCIFAKHASLWRRSKHWLGRNQDSVSECSDMSSFGRTVISMSSHYQKINKRVGLAQSGHNYHLIECNLLSPRYSWKIANRPSKRNFARLLQDCFGAPGTGWDFSQNWGFEDQ